MVLDAHSAEERGEEPIQLLESRIYDFALANTPTGAILDESRVVQANRVNPMLGRIEPGLATGLLTLQLVDEDRRPIAAANVEVRTNKIGYHTEYRRMLDDIADASTALLMDIRGASQARLQTSTGDVETLHQRFVIVRALLERRELQDAVLRILGSPQRRWLTRETELDPRRAFRARGDVLRQIAQRRERVSIPRDHAVRVLLHGMGVDVPSLPSRFRVREHYDTVDTPENRFVKFALEDWESFLLTIERRLGDGSPAARRVGREAAALRRVVSIWLAHDLFHEVGVLQMLPFMSPVLQRRTGYREVLRAWTTFRLTTSLSWRGGSDVFAGGKRDVALLYEYWVFFKLLDLVRRIFDIETPPSSQLLEVTNDGLDLRLRAGRQLSFMGRYAGSTKPLLVRFSYNRTFPGANSSDSNYPDAGAWTRPMRPDYTLTLWPAEFSEPEAERQELIVHVHFDAKYRVEELTGLFGRGDDDELMQEREAFREGNAPKRADLLKMHAYRDAIRRSEGAYVIFPGRKPTDLKEWRAFTEILPGLGAFALVPGDEETSLSLLETFLHDIADLAADEARRLEQNTYHRFRIQERSGIYRPNVELPTVDEKGRLLRKRPSSES